MGRVWQLASSFNRGELDPRLVGRKDLQAYYAGAQRAQNVTTLVQGGVRRRNGTEYLYTSTNGRIFNFSFSTSVNYCLLFTNLNIAVFKDGVFQVNITSPYTLAQVQDLDFIQSADTALLFHGDVQTRKLTRTSDVLWTLSSVSYLNIPQYDFDDSLSPADTAEEQLLSFANQNEGDRYKIGLEGILTDEILFAGDDAANVENIRSALIALPNTGGEGTVNVVTVTTGVSYRCYFVDASAKPWELMTGTPVYTQSTSFEITATRSQTGVSRAEDVWSNTRGWPQVATFHEGRLWVGGTNYRPATVWGSKVNYFFDFNKGKVRDDEAIDVTLDTDQVNAVTGLFSNRTLQVFTSGGEFSIPTSPITPENVAILPQTNFGAKKVMPVTIDGVTLFVQRTGKALRSFFFVDESKAYSSSSISVLASHLISNPIEMAVSKGATSVDANYAYILNDDGTMSVYNSLAAEEVQGFTDWVTDVEIVSIAVVDDTLYTYVNRLGTYFLEREDPDLTTDSSASATSTDTLTGLSHLDGETIDVVADGAYQGQFVVTGGEVTIDRTADLIYGGLNYTPILQTMPLNVGLGNGPNAALPKRIVRVGLELFESNGVIVNGQRIADKTMGLDVFEAPIPKTGLERIFLQGWSVEAVLTITQEEPMPMTVLAAYLEISL